MGYARPRYTLIARYVMGVIHLLLMNLAILVKPYLTHVGKMLWMMSIVLICKTKHDTLSLLKMAETLLITSGSIRSKERLMGV
jgi:hypothetical protein